MAEKILNTQKSIAGQKEGAAGSSGVREYEVSTNVARDSNEVKRTRMYVEKNDGTNISGVLSTGQVLSFDATTNRLKFIDVVGGAVAFLFASSIAQFTVSEASMIGFAAANAFDPITNGTTVVATVGHA
jgi:hypothetical protein